MLITVHERIFECAYIRLKSAKWISVNISATFAKYLYIMYMLMIWDSHLFTQLMSYEIMIILLRIDFLNWIWKGFIYARKKKLNWKWAFRIRSTRDCYIQLDCLNLRIVTWPCQRHRSPTMRCHSVKQFNDYILIRL